jgi:hypothetical protein
MMRLLVGTVMLTFVSVAYAQQPPQQSPMDEALSGKLQEEYNQNIQLRAALIEARKELAALKDKEAKDADKKPDPKKP